MTFSNGSASANDGAIHAFYKLSRAELIDLLNDVVAARTANGGAADLGPLAAHPLIVKQGCLARRTRRSRPPFSSTPVRRRSPVSPSSPRAVRDSSGTSAVSTSPTAPRSRWSSRPCRAAARTRASRSRSATARPSRSRLRRPRPTTTCSFANSNSAKAATAGEQQTALDAAFKIESPDFESPNTIDCASCHTTGLAKSNASDLHLSLSKNPNAFVPDAKFVSAADAKATTPFDANKGTNLHMFSYRGSDLMIGQRVVNETAGVVAYLNGTLR